MGQARTQKWAPILVGFGARADHPRTGVDMYLDAWLGDLDTADPVDLVETLASQANQQVIFTAGGGVHCALVGPDGAGWHLGGSDLGWSIDVYGDIEAARAAIDKLCSCGGGSLRVHGEYGTDGSSIYRHGVRVGPARIVRPSDCLGLRSIREWAARRHRLDGIVSVIAPELSPEMLVSYDWAIEATGLRAQSLRTMVYRAEGIEIPSRQFSTPTGSPLWSQPVLNYWAGWCLP